MLCSLRELRSYPCRCCRHTFSSSPKGSTPPCSVTVVILWSQREAQGHCGSPAFNLPPALPTPLVGSWTSIHSSRYPGWTHRKTPKRGQGPASSGHRTRAKPCSGFPASIQPSAQALPTQHSLRASLEVCCLSPGPSTLLAPPTLLA